MERLILHCDLNNFYASVECLLNPMFKNVPLIVAGNPEDRHGVVLAKNDIAKAAGIKTGDTVWQAKQKISGLVTTPPHFDLYMQYSERAKAIYTRYTPLVEPFGADECWLDCTGSVKLFGDGKKIADDIRTTLKEELCLTVSAGVSFNKIFAKLGSDLKKPDATTLISRENFQSVVWPLPVAELFMAGRKTTEKLHKYNIHTIGELAVADEVFLKTNFGANGLMLQKSAQGLNDEPVRQAILSHQNKSYGHGMTAGHDITNFPDLSALIYYLAERIAARMRQDGVRGCGIAVDLRSNELKHLRKQCTHQNPLRGSGEIAAAALSLSKDIWNGHPPLRTITVSIFDLTDQKNGQLSIFGQNCEEKSEGLDLAVEKIRKKYGSEAIIRADLAGRDFIYDKTDSEDFLPFKR